MSSAAAAQLILHMKTLSVAFKAVEITLKDLAQCSVVKKHFPRIVGVSEKPD